MTAPAGRGGSALGRLMVLLSGNAAISALSFARNLLVARLISVEDYGIAATFALVTTLTEMVSQLGVKQYLVQTADGDEPRVQAGLQGVSVLRGVVNAAAIVALALPVATFLRIPELAWAYALMALVPLTMGLAHMDEFRLQRAMRFGPMVAAQLGSTVLCLVAVWPLHLIFGDWRTMLGSIMVRAAAQVALTHLMAERRYALRLEAEMVRRVLGFGWPLMLNGLLLFLVYHGEKFLVGRELDLAALGILSMGVTLTLTPLLVSGKTLQGYFLPQLSRAEGARFARLAGLACDTNVAGGLVVLIGVALVGPPFVQAVLGDKYDPLLPYLVPLAVLQAVRSFKSGPSVIALARARTRLPMWANLPRVALLGAAWAALAAGGGLMSVVLIGILAETAGVVLSYALIAREGHVSLRAVAPRLALPALVILAALGLDLAAWGVLPGQGGAAGPAVRLAFLAALGVGALWIAARAAAFARARRAGAAP